MLVSNFVIAARSTENAADSCANDDDVMNDDDRHTFSMLEICNKRNKFFFKKLKFLSSAYVSLLSTSIFNSPPIDIHIGAFQPPPLMATTRAYLLSDFFPTPRLLSPPFYSGLESSIKGILGKFGYTFAWQKNLNLRMAA